MKAKIRCICGREHSLTENERITCRCGASISIEIDKRGAWQPWAHVEDNYDLTKRKNNKPKIVGWVE